MISQTLGRCSVHWASERLVESKADFEWVNTDTEGAIESVFINVVSVLSRLNLEKI